jgi:Na+-driven multidrug efflux pump
VGLLLLLLLAAVSHARGVKDTRTPLNAAIGAAVTHITLTPLFILGEWQQPGLVLHNVM